MTLLWQMMVVIMRLKTIPFRTLMPTEQEVHPDVALLRSLLLTCEITAEKPKGAATSKMKPPSPARKRSSVEHEGSDQSDEEPPTKKQRMKPVTTSQNGKEAKDLRKANEKEGRKFEMRPRKSTQEGVTLSDDIEDRKPKKIDGKAALKKKTGEEGSVSGTRGKESKEQMENGFKTKSKISTQPPIGEELEKDKEEESDHDESEESEEERPEVAAKARAQVQTTLTSKTKDPHPDWRPGDPVPYAALCATFSKIEMTTKRLEIQAHCSLFLRQILRLTPKDLLPTVLLMVNKLAADYAGIELGIGESLIMKAIGETTGRSLAIVKADQNEIGDLGLVAAKSRSNQPTMFKPKPLTVRGVHEGLIRIATTTEGQGSQTRKVDGIKKLLSAADPQLLGKGSKGVDITKDKGGLSEAKFIIRALEGKMRLGLAEKTVLVALSQAMVMHEALQKNGKPVGDDQLVKGESMLKSVYK